MYIIGGDLNLEFNSKLYTYFINKLKNKLKVYINNKEVITDNIERKQVDYIITCYNKKNEYQSMK